MKNSTCPANGFDLNKKLLTHVWEGLELCERSDDQEYQIEKIQSSKNQEEYYKTLQIHKQF